jgi:hypothetical protein
MTQSNNALAIFKEYPAAKFNLLIPVKSMQEISPVHKILVNEVQLDPNPNNKDVYKEKNGELALTKKALAKLMAGANIQLIDSKPIPPQKCERCIQTAERTRIAPKCQDCQFADDVAYQITLAVPEPSGNYRMVKATKELRLADEKTKMTDAQFKNFLPYRTEQCETKALNRALREALMLPATYKPEELQKPFAVALVVPNFSDPDMKKAMVQRYARGESALFGTAMSLESGQAEQAGPTMIEGGRTIDTSTREIFPQPEITVVADDSDDLPPGLAGFSSDEPEPVNCEGDDCGRIIESYKDNNGVERSVEELTEISQKLCKKNLCGLCIKKEVAAKQKAGEK